MVKLLADHGRAANGAFRVGHGLRGGPTPLALNATSTVYGMVGQPLSYLPFVGGVAPVTSEHTSPVLPDGITFSGGVYSGTPTGAAVAGSITGSATDAYLDQVNWSTVTFNVAAALQISHSAPASVVEDAAYDSGSFAASGGHSPLSLHFLNLPAGVAPVDNSVQGSIADAGSYSYDVRVTDNQGFQETITVSLTVQTNEPTGTDVVVGDVTFPLTSSQTFGDFIDPDIAWVTGPLAINHPTPDQTVDSGGLVMNGVELNPEFETTTNWDERATGGDYDAVKGQPSYPLALVPGDIVVKAISEPNYGAERNGVVRDYKALVVVDAPPPPNTLAPAVIGWSGRGTPISHAADFDAALANLAKYTISGPVPSFDEVWSQLDKLNIGLSITNDASAGYEFWTPYNFGATTGTTRNYGRNQAQVIGAAALLMISNHISEPQRLQIAIRMAQMGCQWYDTHIGAGVVLQPDGGHYQFHLIPVVWYLLVTGQTVAYANLMNDMPGNFGQAFQVSAAQELEAITPHDDLYQFCFTRRRKVLAVNGLNIQLESDTTLDGGDNNRLVFTGMPLVRVSDGATAIIASTSDANAADDSAADFVLDAQPATPFAVNDDVYLLPAYPVLEGNFEWGITQGSIDARYIASKYANYRELARFSDDAMALMVIARAFGADVSQFDAIIGYVTRCALPDEPAGHDFPTPHDVFQTYNFAELFWTQHRENIFGVPDATIPVLTNAAASSITQTTATITVDISEDNGIVSLLVNDNATEDLETIEAGGPVSGIHFVQVGETQVTFDLSELAEDTVYNAHLGMRDAVGNPSEAVSFQFSTTAEPTVGVFAPAFRANDVNPNNGPYTFENVPIGPDDGTRTVYVFAFARGGSGSAATIAIRVDGVEATPVPNAVANDGFQAVGCWSAQPSGSTAKIEIDMAGARGGYAVWTSGKSVVADAASGDGEGVTVDIPAGGFVIAYGAHFNDTGNPITGLTDEQFDQPLESGITHVGAHQLFTSAQANYAIDQDGTSGDMISVVVVQEEVTPFAISYGWDPVTDLGTDGTLFVDAARPDDSGDGASVATAKKTIQAAVDLAAPGDTIKIRGGTYEEAVDLTGVLGTSVSPIAIERYGAERPIVSGQTALTGWQPCVSADSAILGAKWISCFKVQNFPVSNLAAGVPLAMNLHENGQRLYVATDRADKSDLFWISWVESFHGYLDQTGLTFLRDGEDYVTGVTHGPVLGTYTETQLLQAYIRYFSSGNSTAFARIETFNGSDTVTINGPQKSQGTDYRYSLENIGPAIEAGQFAFTDNGDGTIDIFVFPGSATTVAELDAAMSYASKTVGIDISNASYLDLRGLETFGQAGDGQDLGCGFATQTGSTAKKNNVTLEHCFAHGIFATNGNGYGGFYLSHIENLTVANCQVEETQGAYGFFFAGDGANTPNLRHALCFARRTNNAPYRNFGVHEGVSAFNYAVDCGLDTHANKGNTYDDCNHVVVWGYNYDQCRGFYALQRASNITLAFNQIPSLPRDETGNGTPRGIQVQNKDPIPFPNDPTRFFNNIVLPEIPVGTGVAISFDNAFNIEPLFGFNNVTHGITTDVGDNGSAYDPPITPAPITTDYNVVTALAPSQTEANLGANSVYEADLDEVVADNYALDYTPPPGSPILTTPGRDMTPEIDALKARFPDVAHFFDHDMNGHPIDWSVPFVGHDASLAFTHGAPAKVTGLSQVPADGEIALSWVEPADNGSPILDYVIQRSADGGVTWFTVPHPAITDTSFTDAGLVNGSDYTHRVAAVNANGQGRWSDRETERPVAAANVAAEDDMTADTSALYVPRNGAEVVVWNETEARIDMTTPSSGVASFMGVYHEVDLTGHVGVPLKLTMDLENVSSSVAILVEFGTSADADKWAETPAGLLDEDGTSETVVMLDDRNAGTTGQGFIVTQPINRITFYFRGLANPDETFGIGPWRIERFAQ